MRRRSRLWPAVALGGILVCAAARAEEGPRNLLLVTLDTFRADHLGTDDGAPSATPNLDRLAAAGARFTRARAPVPLTLPSHASIFTSLYPRDLGVRDNGEVLEEGPPSLAEVLRDSGYATAAFVGSFVLDHRFGLGRGFDHYDDRVAETPEMLDDLAGLHDRHALGHLGHHAQVMGDQDDRRPHLAAQVAHQVQDLGLDGHVQRGGGLVGDQQFGDTG
jgi:arylsulfatase A-like enzyme